MATTFEKLSSNKVKLGFVVHSEQFDEGIRKAYAKNAKKFNIPGFRRGKAPMKIIENFYGAGVFYEDAFDIIFPELYRAALAEHDVKPVDRPELEVEQIEKGKELKFTVEVFVRPDVELGEYRNLGIARTVDEVTDDDVMAEIERARDRAARFIEVTDRPASLDDQANIDYEGFVNGEPFDGELRAVQTDDDGEHLHRLVLPVGHGGKVRGYGVVGALADVHVEVVDPHQVIPRPPPPADDHRPGFAVPRHRLPRVRAVPHLHALPHTRRAQHGRISGLWSQVMPSSNRPAAFLPTRAI